MRESWLIAKREYLERVRSKSFRISTILIPLIFAAIFGLGSLSGKSAGGANRIVIASNDPTLAQGVRAGLLESATSPRSENQPEAGIVAPASAADLAALDRQVKEGTIDGYLWLNMKPGDMQPDATYVSRSSAGRVAGVELRTAIAYALTREVLIERGASSAEAESLMQGIRLKTRELTNSRSAGPDGRKAFWGAYAMALLLNFVVLLYGMNVGRSVVAEKTSRVFEVILATAQPESLMAGKLLGVGGAGLTQLTIWIGAALLLSSPALGAQLGAGGLSSFGISAQQLIFFVIYFLLGFFFYSALAAGFGATVSQESELQQFSMVLMLPLVVGLVLILYILANPNAWPVVFLSLFPPCMPVVMCLRMSATTVPWWQLGLSLVLMLVAIYGVLWLVARVYRVGILMYGKRATLPEILRWLRYS